MNFLKGAVSHSIFSADPAHDPNPVILTDFFIIVG